MSLYTVMENTSSLMLGISASYNLYQLPTEIAPQPDIVNISSFVRLVGGKISQSDGMVMGVNNLYYGALVGLFDSSAVYWPYQLVNTSKHNIGKQAKTRTRTSN